MKIFGKMAFFTLIMCVSYIYVGKVVTDISGGGSTAVVEGINPEAGEAIFWGKGKCGTCHTIGTRGSAIRCPNLGAHGKFSLPIGARAAKRAKEISKKRGIPFTATDYFIETIAHPGAYVVEGFKNEMPYVYKPPISLSPDEIKAIITYLQSLGGEVDVAAIKLPDIIKEASAGSAVLEAWKPYMVGDAEEGEELFFDLESNVACAKCHKIKGKGGKVGPELTTVAGTRSAQFIIESILYPSVEIASGYEPSLIITKSGKYITGIIKEEDDTAIKLLDNKGTILTVEKADIEKNVQQKTSIMPGNFSEIITMQEFHNLFAYLQTLK